MSTDWTKCGIYRWLNTANGKSYIGSAVDMEERRKQHLSQLRAGNHVNRKLLNAFNKYGEQSFEFEILGYCLERDLLFNEQLAIDAFGACRNGYNICPVAGRPMAGRKHSALTRQLMSGPRGKQSPEWVERRASTRRKKLTPEQREANRRAWETRKARYLSGMSDEGRERQVKALVEHNKSASQKKVVSENIRKYNKSRTPEFIAWATAKATAARLGREFSLPRPI